MSVVFWIVVAVITVASLAGLWMVFEKAGEKGWKAIIPFYNYYVLFRISGHSGWWVLVFVLPVIPSIVGGIVNVASVQGPIATDPNLAALFFFEALAFMLTLLTFPIFYVIIVVQGVLLYDVSRSFGKGLGFTLGLAVLPFIFWPILGFGKDKYRGPVAHPKMVAKGSGAHLPADPTPQEQEKKDDPAAEAKDSSADEEKKEEKQVDSNSSNNE